jgi:RNA polymerase sigma-70 factor, ECF subfamily
MNSLDIWQTFNAPLENFVRSRVQDEEVVKDILQDVYIKIHKHISTLKDETRLRAWVYQIARNTIYDYYRMAHTDILPEDIPVISEDEEQDEIAIRLANSVKAMIIFLPEEYREAVWLAEVENIPQKEIAARLGLSVSGAKSRVQRGRKLLKELFLQCCEVQFDRQGKVLTYYERCEDCKNHNRV